MQILILYLIVLCCEHFKLFWNLCLLASNRNCILFFLPKNDPRIVVNISSVDGNPKASCRAGLQTLPRLGALNQQAMRAFEKMVSESQVRIGEGKNGCYSGNKFVARIGFCNTLECSNIYTRNNFINPLLHSVIYKGHLT